MSVRLLPLAHDRQASEMVSATHRTDKRPSTGYLSQEKIDRAIIDAGLSKRSRGSASAALMMYDLAAYPENPNGCGCGQN